MYRVLHRDCITSTAPTNTKAKPKCDVLHMTDMWSSNTRCAPPRRPPQDMYAFAVCIWAMLTGEIPWKNHNVVSVAYNVHMGRRPPLDLTDDVRCPRKLRKLIEQCWDAEPRRRPAVSGAGAGNVGAHCVFSGIRPCVYCNNNAGGGP